MESKLVFTVASITEICIQNRLTDSKTSSCSSISSSNAIDVIKFSSIKQKHIVGSVQNQPKYQ